MDPRGRLRGLDNRDRKGALKMNRRTLRFIVVVLVPIFFTSAAWADNVESKASVKNKGPQLIQVDLSSSDDDSGTSGVQVSPVPGGAKTVHVVARAQDDNGAKDIESMTLSLIAPDGSTMPPNVNGASGAEQGRTKEFTAQFTLQYYDPPGTYTVRASVVDRKGDSSTLDGTFEYLQLLAFSLDASAIDFDSGALDPGSSTHSTPASVAVRNTGNVMIDVQLSATDMRADGFDASIPADRIKYSSASDMSGEVGLGAVPHTDPAFDLAPGSGASRAAYFDVHVPSGDEQFVPATTYTGSISIGAVVSQ